ncbi:MAG: FkbM family methyltransferase [Opitutaceae bacterium]|nr:FkbM family methyltransferase [Opitutaceae bacterium]
MTSLLRRFLLVTWVADLPIVIPRKPLRGLRWSLFPFTAYWRGRHESHWLEFLDSKLPSLEGCQVWDIGAHFGYYSHWFARAVGPAGHVHAFEPNPHNFHKLALHARRNAQLPITPHPVAVGEKNGTMTMYAYGDAFDTASHMPFAGETVHAAPRSWEVNVIALDDAVRRGELAPPTLIKLDVEGYGGHAVAGAINTIRTALPDIIAGLHSHEENSSLDQQLLPIGYRKLTIEGQQAEYAGGLLDVCYWSPRHAPSLSN